MESIQPTQQVAELSTKDASTFDKIGYIDTHAHLFTQDFDIDRDAVIQRAKEAGVQAIILPAVDSHSSAALISTAQAYPEICFAAIGVHPTSVNEVCNWRDELKAVRRLLANPPVKFYAIGEVGLDMHWNSTNLPNQSMALAIQAQMAIDHNLPMILHVRDAWNAIFPLLDPLKGRIRGVFHSFQGDHRDWHNISELGNFAIGIGGYITYKNSPMAEVVRHIPLESIVIETDAPYLTPVPLRGTRNESANLPIIAAKIAELKGVSVEHVMQTTTTTARNIFFPTH